MTYEWDAGKAAANWKKHGVSFADATTVFLDPLAMTYPDPDHSEEERREITIGHTIERTWRSSATANDGIAFGSSMRDGLPEWNVDCMKREALSRIEDDMRAEYDLSQLKGGVRGKYYRRATAGTNVVLIEPDLASVFPNSESVNRALRLLADTARAATGQKHRRKR